MRPSVVLVTVQDGGTTRQGAGVVIRHGGEILTSAWLVGGAVQVVDRDRRRQDARRRGRRHRRAERARAARDRRRPRRRDPRARTCPGVGNSVVALSGDPHTLGIGVVSATERGRQRQRRRHDGERVRDRRPARRSTTRARRSSTAGPRSPASCCRTAVGAVPIDYARAVADALRNDGVGRTRLARPRRVELAVRPAWSRKRRIAGGPAELAGMRARRRRHVGRPAEPSPTTDELHADVREHWPNQKLTIVVSRGRHVAAARRHARRRRTAQPDEADHHTPDHGRVDHHHDRSAAGPAI